MHPFDVGRSITAVAASSAAVLLSAAAFAASAPSLAAAASYRVWACASGSGAQLGKGDWIRGTSASLADVYDTCASVATPTGAFAANARATSAWSAGGGGWALAAAPGTRISALDLWWSWVVLPSRSGGMIRIVAQGNHYPEPNPGLDLDGSGLCCDDSAFVHRDPGSFGIPTENDPRVAFAEANHQSFPNLRGPDGPGTRLVAVLAACDNFCSTQDEVARYRVYRIKTTVEDATAPAGTSAGLRPGMRVGASAPIQNAAADVGGGVREVTLRVDGQVVQRVTGGDGCTDVDPSNDDPFEYNVMKPCPSSLTAPLALSAAQMPDNEAHTVAVVATDAAGQNTVLSAAPAALAAPPGGYDARNGFYNPDLNITAARRANGSNADAPARLTLGFVRGRRTASHRTARYSARPRIRARLRTADHKPVAHARVWLAAQTQGGQWRISGRPLITSRTGRVFARLPARRPSRQVRLVYFPHTDSNGSAQSPNRGLRVRTTTTIHSDQGGYRNGDTLKFTGRVIRNRLIRSKTVFLQAIVRGKWRTFKTTRASPTGRWRMTHRFEATRRPTVYTFRAVIPSQTGYPWATGFSRRVRVLVTP